MSDDSIKVLLCGAAFSGNMGAEAMYDAIIDGLRRRIPDADIAILSKYPKEDEKACRNRGVKMYSFPTVRQLSHGLPFYMAATLLKSLKLPWRWLIGEWARPFFEYDILADASGIAFSSERSASSLVINTLWFLPAFVSGMPIVKVSQSLGPYDKRYVRIAGKWALQKIDTVICRGHLSYAYTQRLLPRKKLYNLPDAAICLKPTGGERTAELLQKHGLTKNRYIVVGPSFVMRGFLKDDYIRLLSACIQEMRSATDMPIALIPHSRKHVKETLADSVSDDLDVCRETARRVWQDSQIQCVIVEEAYSSHELKSIIGNAHMAFGSRFHFLVAALSSGVPSMAVGWSHKYKELFDEFGVGEFAKECRERDKFDDSMSDMLETLKRLLARQADVKKAIQRELPDVMERSKRNIELICERIAEIKRTE